LIHSIREFLIQYWKNNKIDEESMKIVFPFHRTYKLGPYRLIFDYVNVGATNKVILLLILTKFDKLKYIEISQADMSYSTLRNMEKLNVLFESEMTETDRDAFSILKRRLTL